MKKLIIAVAAIAAVAGAVAVASAPVSATPCKLMTCTIPVTGG